MCGIVGYVGRHDGVPILLEGLHRLEYRGYDSAGVAVIARGGLRVHKAEGKVRDVDAALPRASAVPGIAHTRWATHGEPSDVNAHPHVDGAGRIASCTTGSSRTTPRCGPSCRPRAVVFSADTDTEVLAHLIAGRIGGDLDRGGTGRR